MKQLSWRQMLIIDFCCAFAGGVIYLLFFDLFTQSIGIPVWLAKAQIFANLAFGLYGFQIHLFRTANTFWFRALILLNAAYAASCLIMGVMLAAENYVASAVLAVEAIIIFALVNFELKSLKSSTQD